MGDEDDDDDGGDGGFQFECVMMTGDVTAAAVYDVEWTINGDVVMTETKTAADVVDGRVTSVMGGDKLDNYTSIEEVSRVFSFYHLVY